MPLKFRIKYFQTEGGVFQYWPKKSKMVSPCIRLLEFKEMKSLNLNCDS